ADFGQALHAWRRNAAFRSRPDVQQIVSTLRDDVDQIADDGLRRFPSRVVGLVPPRLVHRHAALPIDAGKAARRDLLFRRAEIAAVLAVLPVESLHDLPAFADAV